MGESHWGGHRSSYTVLSTAPQHSYLTFYGHQALMTINYVAAAMCLYKRFQGQRREFNAIQNKSPSLTQYDTVAVVSYVQSLDGADSFFVTILLILIIRNHICQTSTAAWLKNTCRIKKQNEKLSVINSCVLPTRKLASDTQKVKGKGRVVATSVVCVQAHHIKASEISLRCPPKQ